MQSSFASFVHGHFQPACGDYYAHGEHAHQPLYFPPASYPLFDPHIFLGQSPLSPPALVLPPYDDSRYSDPFPSLSSTYEDYPPQHGQHEPPNESTPLIHSPIPVSAYSTLLAHVEYASQESSTSSPKSPQAETLHESSQDVAHSHPTIIALSPAPEHPPLPPAFDISEDGDLKSRGTVEPYTALHATFPTPSELLNGLMQDKSEASAVSGAHVPVEVLDACQLSDPPSPPSQPAARARNRARIPSTLRPAQPGKPENLRKGYFRSVADNVGFQPTDPDTVTSHDKKRHYLECLEQYILWLHDQIGLAGHAPSRLERIDSYRGLNSPTIRTLLVHMQNQTRKLHQRLMTEEHKYLESERRALSQPPDHVLETDSVQPEYPVVAERARRHSIANGMIPMCAASHIPPLPLGESSSQVFGDGAT